MEGTIVNFTGSHKTRYMHNTHMVIEVSGCTSREEAVKLVGKPISWKSTGGKEIKGKVASAHGSKGCVRAIFERGMPGQSLATKVQIG
ncbi:MAG TPA: 50S ribosomal protein L35ae [Candidatus Nanoarchaeia archaeon]|nr:50S ribosomal protein L35ae [Candidatus Nanoarchaeia archaeon]